MKREGNPAFGQDLGRQSQDHQHPEGRGALRRIWAAGVAARWRPELCPRGRRLFPPGRFPCRAATHPGPEGMRLEPADRGEARPQPPRAGPEGPRVPARTLARSRLRPLTSQPPACHEAGVEGAEDETGAGRGGKQGRPK